MVTGLFKKATDAALLLCVICCSWNCRKGWLDAKPAITDKVPETLGDCQLLLDNTVEMNTNSCAIGEIGADDHYINDSGWALESDQEHNAYTWTHERLVIASTDWNASYRRIFYSNLVLEILAGIKPSSVADQQLWNELKGAALFHRGRTFFELAQVFAPDYTLPLSTEKWGIPLRLNADVNEQSVRSTVGETYAQVLADLHDAAALLPLSTAYKTRPCRPAAFAMMARVYLSMQIYDLAYLYADSCLRFRSTLIDYNRLDSTAENPVPQFNDEVLFHASLVRWGNIGKDAIADPALVASYEQNDLRRGVIFNCSTPEVRYKGSYGGSALLFSGLATDEQYLIRAECEARHGDSARAMRDIEILLQKRYKANTALPAPPPDKTSVLRRVLNERRKELLFRGLRWTDLRRLNHSPADSLSIHRTINGHSFLLAPGSFRYTFPIPDDIIQQSGMAQNPGW
ncbi:MAG: RagB/SusD family nutrient uptake outer membrane protein [Bacteroidetes bacterium]|nr:RagB/SusD family nutrient uptake outer membrane protein [Bacteroidota bacterium]